MYLPRKTTIQFDTQSLEELTDHYFTIGKIAALEDLKEKLGLPSTLSTDYILPELMIAWHQYLKDVNRSTVCKQDVFKNFGDADGYKQRMEQLGFWPRFKED